MQETPTLLTDLKYRAGDMLMEARQGSPTGAPIMSRTQ